MDSVHENVVIATTVVVVSGKGEQINHAYVNIRDGFGGRGKRRITRERRRWRLHILFDGWALCLDLALLDLWNLISDLGLNSLRQRGIFPVTFFCLDRTERCLYGGWPKCILDLISCS